MDKKLIKESFALAFGEAAYVAVVATAMWNAQYVLPERPGAVGIVAFLLLFVLSATVSGALILGRPILLYLDGKRPEAFRLFGATIAWVAVFIVGLILWLALRRS